MSEEREQKQTEIDDLARFSGIVEMSKSSAFLELMGIIDGIVSEAHESLVACMSAEPMVRMGLSMRYQQRIAMQREIKNWIESAARGHDEILETMRRELETASQRGEQNL